LLYAMRLIGIVAMGFFGFSAITQESMSAATELKQVAENTHKGHRMPPVEKLGPGDDVVFLTQLDMIEGHVLVGIQLYEMGEREMAMDHVMHPVLEIYDVLKPALKRQGIKGFAPEIEALVAAVESGAKPDKVRSRQRKLLSVIHGLRDQRTELKASMLSLKAMMQIIGDEYQVGVQNGVVQEEYEYQDSWGFLQVVRKNVASLHPDIRSQYASDISRMETVLAGMDVFWPDITGRTRIGGKSSQLAAAVAEVETVSAHLR
jgi:hypothetical protein